MCIDNGKYQIMLDRQQLKEIRRAAKQAHREAMEQHRAAKAAGTYRPVKKSEQVPIDCACVIHGDAYDWTYVDRLYNMLNRNLTPGIRMHVYTEAERAVPSHMIKHCLQDWPEVNRPKKAWWYKMQLFNPEHHAGTMLYLDLDTVITGNLDWIQALNTRYFWTINDFRYLWKPGFQGINSSMMWWDTQNYSHIWNGFVSHNLQTMTRKYHGDQDYLTAVLDRRYLKFFDRERIQSWRWQAFDGGMNFAKRRHNAPNTGTTIAPDTSVLVFHGSPKPHEIQDAKIQNIWI